jgi:hypothetical protein
VRHLHEVEIVHDPLMLLGPALLAAQHLAHGKLHVVVNREPGQQRVVLEHHRPVGSRLLHLIALEQDGARCDLRKSGDQVEQGRLAAPGMADDRDHLALLDLERDIVQHVGLHVVAGERFVDMVDLEIGAHDDLLQLAVVPRVTSEPTAATSRSSRKPTTPI